MLVPMVHLFFQHHPNPISPGFGKDGGGHKLLRCQQVERKNTSRSQTFHPSVMSIGIAHTFAPQPVFPTKILTCSSWLKGIETFSPELQRRKACRVPFLVLPRLHFWPGSAKGASQHVFGTVKR